MPQSRPPWTMGEGENRRGCIQLGLARNLRDVSFMCPGWGKDAGHSIQGRGKQASGRASWHRRGTRQDDQQTAAPLREFNSNFPKSGH